jgi:HlyD family secretion protein
MSKPNRRRFVVLGVVAALALLAVYRTGVLRDWVTPAPSDVIVLSGNIEAHESVLSFKGVQSRVVALPFDEGQWVKKGATLAVVDSRDLKQQVAIADAVAAVQTRQLDAAVQNLLAARKTVDADVAALAQRELDLQRNQDLQKQGFVSTAALDNTNTALTQARAVLARDQALVQVAERNIKVLQASSHSAEESAKLSRITESYAVLSAPFDGVILARQAEVGEVVAPGTPIVTIADLDHVWLRAYLNETDVGRVKLGQAVTVTTDSAPKRQFLGRVSSIASQAEYTPKSVETHAERVTLVYRIKIDIDNPDHFWVPGMPADAKITAALPR